MSTNNDPDACSTVTALHDAYEQALMANDVDALHGYFRDSPDTIRYGVAEQSYGTAEISQYRHAAQKPAPGRRVIRRHAVSFGPDVVSLMCEITAGPQAGATLIRQSQLWVRFPDLGWRIVSAHVSRPHSPGRPWADYAVQAARAASLPLSGEELPGVALHLERAAGIAAPLLAHPVPDSVERAMVFSA